MRFAKLNIDLIEHFGELTKREIQVYLFLLARADARGNCWPGRKEICKGTTLAAPHVSTAVGGLIEKRWIVQDGKVYKITESVINQDEIITELVTENYQNGNITESVKLPNEYQNVTKSVTEITDLVITHNINSLNRPIRDQEETNLNGEAPSDCSLVFSHWLKTFPNRSGSRLTDDRHRKIRARLKTFSAADLCRAIDAAAADPFLCGDNDRQKPFTDFSTIFKNDSYVEGLLLPKPIGKNRDTFAKHDAGANDAGSGVTGPHEAPRRPAEGSAKALELWERIRSAIRSQVAAEIFADWFDLIFMDGFASHDFKLRAPSVAVDWIEANYSELLRSAIIGVIGTENFGILWTRDPEA